MIQYAISKTKSVSRDYSLILKQTSSSYSTVQSRRPESRASRSSFGQESSHGSYGFKDLQNPLHIETASTGDRQHAQHQHSSQHNLLPPLSGAQSTSVPSQDPFGFGSLPHRDTSNSLLSSQQASAAGFGNPSQQQNPVYQNVHDQQLSAPSTQLPLSSSRPSSRTAEAYAPVDPPPSYSEGQTGYESFPGYGQQEFYNHAQWQGGS